MFLTVNRKSLFLATAIALVASQVRAQSDTQEVALNFAAYVGDSEFVCGESYENIGTAESTVTPKDFRFYVSEVALIDEAGNAVPVELEQDGKWQYQNVALLDFEDGTSACSNGTAEMNTLVTGTVPEGDYQSVQFTLGVPKSLNHKDASIAPSPLNLTSMWWNWQGGYKFLRTDLETDRAIVNVGSNSQTTHSQTSTGNVQTNQQTTTTGGSGSQSTTQTSNQTSIFKNGQGSQQQSSTTTTSDGNTTQTTHSQSGNGTHGEEAVSSNAYFLHLGSTGCSDSAQSNLFDCANPNRVLVVLEDFDPGDDTIIADLGELLAQSDLSTNQANTPNGCMSSTDDADCSPIVQNLGLVSAGEQYFFFVE